MHEPTYMHIYGTKYMKRLVSIRIGNTPTFTNFDLYLYSAYAAYTTFLYIYIYIYIYIVFSRNINQAIQKCMHGIL